MLLRWVRPKKDSGGLIDGVVASEPVTEMPTASGYGIQFGGAAVTGYGKTLADSRPTATSTSLRCAGHDAAMTRRPSSATSSWWA